MQVATANQTLKAAEANFRAARGSVAVSRSFSGADDRRWAFGGRTPRIAQSALLQPQPGQRRGRQLLVTHRPELRSGSLGTGPPWRDCLARRGSGSAADLATALLSLQAELALDYFNLRATDTQLRLLDDTVKAYQEALKLTQDRYDEGITPLSDVSQARTQLEAAQVLRTDLTNDRAAFQHAIAVLIGEPPANFHLDPLPSGPEHSVLPKIPLSLPSQLLERRPDIASMERHMAAANEQIGIAPSRLLPHAQPFSVDGFPWHLRAELVYLAQRFWAVGPTLSETIFDAGRRKAGVAIAQANYDATVANYRQTVLTSFGQVEDNLAALRILETEAEQQHAATHSAEQTLDLFQTRYQGGVDTYLQVITSQTAALLNERNDIQIQLRRQQASVLLIKALGGRMVHATASACIA